MSRPTASQNFRAFQLSSKKPRASANTWGSRIRTSGIDVGMTFIRDASLRGEGHLSLCPPCGTSLRPERDLVPWSFLGKDSEQVLAIAVLGQGLRQSLELSAVNEAHPKCNLFRAANLHALALLDGLDEHRGLQKRLVRAGIKPREATPENLD